MKSFVHSGGVSRPKRARDNGRHIACEMVDRFGFKAMAGETAAGARKFGGNAASVHRRVEDNAFHLTL